MTRHFGRLTLAAGCMAAAATVFGLAAPNAAVARGDAPLDQNEISAECGEIDLAEFSWPTAGLSSRLLEIVLADGYGCEVRRTPAAPARAASAIAEADAAMRAARKKAAPLGGAPIDAPAAIVAVGAQIDGFGTPPKGVVVGAELYGGLDRGGWFAPTWLTASHPDLRRIEDAARRPEVFSHSPNAKPRLHICPESWACHEDDRALIAQLRLEERFEIVVPASGDALTASLIDAWRHRRPWLGSYWTPSAAVAEYSMTRLENGALEVCRKLDDGETSAQAVCHAPHRSPPRVTLYPEALEAAAPRVAATLRRFALPPEVALDALAWRATSNADLDDAALQLLDSRPSLWRTWLDEPARRRFGPALQERLARADARAAKEKTERKTHWPSAAPREAAPREDGALDESAQEEGASATARPKG